DGHFALPDGRSRQQQVRYVCARDQQHEHNRHEQDDQGSADGADCIFEHRNDVDAIPCHVWELLLNLICDHVQISLRLRARYARFETADDREKKTETRRAHPLVRGQRPPDLGIFGKPESGWHYPYYQVRLVAERDLLVQNSGIGAETSLPETVAQNNYFILSRLLFLGSENSPECGVHAYQLEEIDRYSGAANLFRLAGSSEVVCIVGHSGHPLESFVPIAPVYEIRIRGDVIGDSLPPVVTPDHRQLLRLRIWHRAQQHAVDDAEDRRVRADAQRQR